MSADRDVTRIVRSWLEEGVTALPDRVLDAVLDQVPATRQRRAWWPARRLPTVNTPLRIAMAAAAVVVLALVGINLMPKTGGAGGIGGSPSTPLPTASPSPTPSPTPAPAVPSSGALAPGTYRLDFITFTLPAGWDAGGWLVSKQNSGPVPGDMVVATWRDIGTVYSDPCHWQSTPVSTIAFPTVDTLVTALVAQKRGTTATPTDVTIDGFRGKEIDLMVPLSIKVTQGTNADGGSEVVTGCEGGLYKGWSDTSGGDRYHQGPGQHDLLDILDVNGKVLVIDRVFWPANTPADLAEQKALFDSIKITP